MDLLLDPNIAYLVLLAGVILTFMAIVVPGTGMPEAGAIFCLALAGYAVYRLSINLWALIVLALSVVPFVFAVRKPKREFLLGLSILGLVVGSVFLFARADGLPAVNPWLALIASVLVTGFLWIAVRKSVQASMTRPMQDLGTLVGEIGNARTPIHEEGSAYVAGELWSARSKTPIPVGSSICVIRREGFILVVEKNSSSKI
jgi:membrane-bound serine protease (ClpP class)